MEIKIKIPKYVVENLTENELNPYRKVPESIVKEFIICEMLGGFIGKKIKEAKDLGVVDAYRKWFQEANIENRTIKASLKSLELLSCDLEKYLKEKGES